MLPTQTPIAEEEEAVAPAPVTLYSHWVKVDQRLGRYLELIFLLVLTGICVNLGVLVFLILPQTAALNSPTSDTAKAIFLDNVTYSCVHFPYASTCDDRQSQDACVKTSCDNTLLLTDMTLRRAYAARHAYIITQPVLLGYFVPSFYDDVPSPTETVHQCYQRCHMTNVRRSWWHTLHLKVQGSIGSVLLAMLLFRLYERRSSARLPKKTQ